MYGAVGYGMGMGELSVVPLDTAYPSAVSPSNEATATHFQALGMPAAAHATYHQQGALHVWDTEPFLSLLPFVSCQVTSLAFSHTHEALWAGGARAG